jgi:hypothetical protein
MEDGSTKRVDELQLNEVLEGGGEVEGILETLRDGPCVCVKGVVLSGSHLVEHEGRWVFASLHPAAEPVKSPPDRLFCLNTTTHTWTTESGLVLRDWEELPDGNDMVWEEMIEHMLNKSMTPRHASAKKAAGRGLCGEATLVWDHHVGPKTLRDVRLGDFIKDRRNQFTRVVGIYHDRDQAPRAGPSEATWVWSTDEARWVHPPGYADGLDTSPGMQIFTETGTFVIYGNQWIRDFTEVGSTLIHHTYPFTQSLLHFAKP